jgi:hypothetical protein
MNRFGAKFHHFGLAVHTPDNAFAFLKALGYHEGASEYDPLQGVNLAMRYHPDAPDIEVIWPGPGPSPIDNLLKKRDSLIYHLCYTTSAPEATLAAIEAEGLQVLSLIEPRPAILFGGLEVSFHHVAGFGLIELIHGEPLNLYPSP